MAGADRSLRRLVTETLGTEQFVAGFHRRTDGTPCHPERSRAQYETIGDLSSDPRDDGAVWEELIVYSSSHVYRWDGAGLDDDPTRLPRSPDDVELRE